MDSVKVAMYEDPGVGRAKGDEIIIVCPRELGRDCGVEGRLCDWSMMVNGGGGLRS